MCDVWCVLWYVVCVCVCKWGVWQQGGTQHIRAQLSMAQQRALWEGSCIWQSGTHPTTLTHTHTQVTYALHLSS